MRPFHSNSAVQRFLVNDLKLRLRSLTIECAVRALRTGQMSRELPMFLPKEHNNAFS
jgi:hypothetical protein